MSEENTCRICFDAITQSQLDEHTVLSPCLCSGTMAFVHQACFSHLRRDWCSICKMRYTIGIIPVPEEEVPEEGSEG